MLKEYSGRISYSVRSIPVDSFLFYFTSSFPMEVAIIIHEGNCFLVFKKNPCICNSGHTAFLMIQTLTLYLSHLIMHLDN